MNSLKKSKKQTKTKQLSSGPEDNRGFRFAPPSSNSEVQTINSIERDLVDLDSEGDVDPFFFFLPIEVFFFFSYLSRIQWKPPES